MSATPRTVRRLVPLASILLLLAGCASVTPIGNLLSNPAKYNGKTVKVEGEVTQSVGAIVAGGYEIKDNTGQLTVVSEGASPPPEGVKIGVKGIFQSLLTLGTKTLAVLKEQSRFNP